MVKSQSDYKYIFCISEINLISLHMFCIRNEEHSLMLSFCILGLISTEKKIKSTLVSFRSLDIPRQCQPCVTGAC